MTEAPVKPPTAPGKRISFALAVLMHVVLAVLIVYGIHWQTKTPEVVEVDLVRAVPTKQSEPADAVPRAPTSAPEPKPEPKPQPKPEPVKPPPKPDIAQKEKPKPPPAPPKPEPKPEPPKDPFKEQLERELKEAEQRKALEAAAQEQAALKTQQANAAQASDLTKYKNAIKGKIRGNIVLPPDIKGNPEAVFEVTQLPSGEVLNVKLKKSSGNPAWDNATERAILKSSPLPKPANINLFSRTLELNFKPQED